MIRRPTVDASCRPTCYGDSCWIRGEDGYRYLKGPSDGWESLGEPAGSTANSGER